MNLNEISNYVESWLEIDGNNDLIELKSWFEKIEITNWENLVGFKDGKYCRHPVASTTEYDVVLICWKPKQGSPAHDHPEKGCIVRIMEGELGDELIKEDNEVIEGRYSVGDVMYINNNMGKHKVFNQSTTNAVSLHIYAPGHYVPNLG